MITITFILAVITLGFFCFSAINAGSKVESENAQTHLSNILDKLFLATPLDNLMGDDKECQLTVRFTVNDNYELTNLRINGNNEKMISYAYAKLSEEAAKIESEIEPSKYDVKLRFILR